MATKSPASEEAIVKGATSLLRRIRDELRSRGSPAYARQMQRFFKEPVQAYGWRTAELRRFAAKLRREIARSGDGQLLFAVAEMLFAGPTLEETALDVVLLERSVGKFGEGEFRRLEGWLAKVRHWGACDALTGVLLGPMIAADSRRLERVFRWAKSKNRWYRRAAAASLIPAARKGLYGKEILRLADKLLSDNDYMVQKAVGWLLKENCKAKPGAVAAYLMRGRRSAPRLTLRIACEKLPQRIRKRILS